MKWRKYTIETTTEAVDFISEMLGELGIEGIEIEDNVPLSEEDIKEMFIDILPELPEDDGSARVSFYLDYDEDNTELLEQVKEGLKEVQTYTEAGSCEITADETEDKDWINNWKEFFKPFTVDDILIKPAWEDIPEEHKDKLCIEMDPGTAFGTGAHETTQLVIRQMRKYLKPGMEVLDVGTGSGILTIAALKLGAAHGVGTDLDPQAITAAGENRERNGIAEKDFDIYQGNILDDEAFQEKLGYEKYDLVLANILAPVIILLSGEIARHMKPGAVIVTSGIINTKEEDVRRAFEENEDFDIIGIEHQGDWVAVTARKR